MDQTVPPLAFVAFGLAAICGTGLFACLFLVTRRLGMPWIAFGLSRSLEPADGGRLMKMLWGLVPAPQDARVSGLLWAVRGFWAGMLVCVLAFVAMVAGVV